MSKLSLTEIQNLVSLANLSPSASDQTELNETLPKVIDLVSQITTLPTHHVAGTSQVTGLVNVFRSDQIDPKRVLTQKQALKNAKKTYKGFFVYPSVKNL